MPKRRLSGKKYFLTLCATCALLLFLPFLAISHSQLNQSYAQLLTANEDAYRLATRSFSARVQAETLAMRKVASRLSLDSRDSQKPAALLGALDGQINRYFYWEAVQILTDYAAAHGYQIGLYYPGLDVLLYRASFDAHSFQADQYPRLSEADKEALHSFLSARGEGETRHFSDGSQMMLGFPVKLGAARVDALALFFLAPNSPAFARLLDDSQANEAYYIFDPQGGALLSSTGAPPLPMPAVQEDAQTLRVGERAYAVFALVGNMDGLVYASATPLDQLAQNAYLFYARMRTLLALESLSFLLLICAVIFINYRPVAKVLREVAPFGFRGGLSDIGGYVERLNAEISEQKLLIMDYLINHLLRGTPIPAAEIARLGPAAQVAHFNVITIFGGTLATADRVQLADAVKRTLGIDLFITDILGQDHTVIISLLPSAEIGGLAQRVRAQLAARACAWEMRVGTVVSSADDIHHSYEHCLRARAQERAPQPHPAARAEAETASSARILQLRDELLAYIQAHYRDVNLSQAATADHFGISTYSLSRLFNNHVGIGFTEYVNGRRLEAAKRLLVASGMSIREIACEVGIANANYFSRLFKTNVGMTPNQYRAAQGGPLRAQDKAGPAERGGR